MVSITKQQEPESLTEYKKRQNPTYEYFPLKEDIRKALIYEQHGVCAYCMDRITKDKMRIEHFKCQKKYSGEALNYNNMLGCCTGHEGYDKQLTHCDVHKQDLELKYNPANQPDSQKMQIYYGNDGYIYSKDADFNDQINSVLNLNNKYIINNRKQIIENLFASLNKKKGTRNKAQIKSYIKKYMTDTGSGYCPYFGVVLYFLNKKLQQG
jgi:uncharacterized protein (TIGR02646 family)